MTQTSPQGSQALKALRRRLQAAGYAAQSIEHLCAASRQFLDYLQEREIAIDAVQPAHVVMYMRRRLRGGGIECKSNKKLMPTNRCFSARLDISDIQQPAKAVGAHLAAKLQNFGADEQTLTDELCDSSRNTQWPGTSDMVRLTVLVSMMC